MMLAWSRREALTAAAGLSILGAATPALAGKKPKDQVVWTFDNLTRIGGVAAHAEGAPKIIDSPVGKAVQFDGVQDVLFVEQHPLAGAETWTFEAVFRPDGGNEAQRWFHLQEMAPEGQPVSTTRFLFEIRTVGTEWWLDAFVTGPGYKHTLIFPDKRFPVGQWFHVAQSFDGKMYRAYVNGVLQGEAEVPFKPQGPGRASIGSRMNKVDFFKGAVHEARFTRRYLEPKRFTGVR
uniref:LamG domain-containing protein n=1 Tax=uncultured Caulobacter sp. TaxID=158749 RepID=UPI0025E484BD|nr:LamG domain-containing protein [uncultured Caulobacter sp.]